MATVHDVAAYILRKQGSMTTWKLQKLAYYSQAWSLVWDERPLFRAPIQAWANGPVIRALYDKHKGQFRVSAWPDGDHSKLTPSEKATINGVLDFYGDKTSQWLSDLTHNERPWQEARGPLPPGERGCAEISHASMHEYYSGLSGGQETQGGPGQGREGGSQALSRPPHGRARRILPLQAHLELLHPRHQRPSGLRLAAPRCQRF